VSLLFATMGYFLFAIAYRPVLGPIQPPVDTRGLYPGVKRPEREADHSRPSSAEAKNAWCYTSAHPVCVYDVRN